MHYISGHRFRARCLSGASILITLTAALNVASLATAQDLGKQVTEPAKPSVVSPDFPRPASDPVAIAHGRQTFGVNCGFCHGSGARGGEGGPNLLRSPIVLNDQNGELLAAVVLNGRPDRGMPKFNLPMSTISEIAAFLHSINVEAIAAATYDPKSVLVGNAAAGRIYFNGKGRCTTCHSVKKDLAGIGAKYDAPHLQDRILTAGGTGVFGEPSPTAPPTHVKASWPSGVSVEGQLVQMDDFIVVLLEPSGERRTLKRDGDVPHIDVANPLQAHLDKVRDWEDRDLHDVTAFLATVK